MAGQAKACERCGVASVEPPEIPPRRLAYRLDSGLTLTAEPYGDPGAPPVLFLHGGGQTRHAWGCSARPSPTRGTWRSRSTCAAMATATGRRTATTAGSGGVPPADRAPPVRGGRLARGASRPCWPRARRRRRAARASSRRSSVMVDVTPRRELDGDGPALGPALAPRDVRNDPHHRLGGAHEAYAGLGRPATSRAARRPPAWRPASVR